MTREKLAQLPDDSDKLTLLARATLLSSSRDGTYDVEGRFTEPLVFEDPSLTMALRIVGYQSDLPDYNVPGTGADVAKSYFAKDPEKPAFTLENISELVS